MIVAGTRSGAKAIISNNSPRTLSLLQKDLPNIQCKSCCWIRKLNPNEPARPTRQSLNTESSTSGDTAISIRSFTTTNFEALQPSQSTSKRSVGQTDRRIRYNNNHKATPHRFLSLHRLALQAETDRFLEVLQGSPPPKSSSDATSASPSSSPLSSRKSYTSQDCYHLLEAWMNLARDREQMSAARQAEEILTALEANAAASAALKPTPLFYDLVLQAYVICNGGPQAAEAAQKLLEHMLHNNNNNNNSNNNRSSSVVPPPTTKSFNIVLNGWAKSRIPTAGKKAETLFHAMQEVSSSTSSQGKQQPIVPNVRTLTSVIEAWANSGHSQASERILAILNVVVDQYRQSGQNDNNNDEASSRPSTSVIIQLDAAVFNAAIRALSRTEPNRRGAEMAEYVLRMLTDLSESSQNDDKLQKETQHDGLQSQQSNRLSPTTQTYSMVLHAWAQCEIQERRGEAAQRAEMILEFMIRQYTTKGWNVKPNVKSFTSCISAWSRCAGSRGAIDAPERAERLLDHLHQLYQQTGDSELKPDTSACNAVLSGWSRSRRQDAPHRTEEAFYKLQQYGALPDLISYNCLLHAYSSVGNAVAARLLLDWMIQQHQTTDEEKPMPWSTSPPLKGMCNDLQQQQQQYLHPPLPDAVSYNSVINCLAKSGGGRTAAEEAENLLDRMEQLAISSTKYDQSPNNVTYTSIIHAWSNSKDPSSGTKAYAIYQRMLVRRSKAVNPQEKMRLRPDIVLAVAVIQACTREEHDKIHALEIAKELFVQIFVPPASSSSRREEYGDGVISFRPNELTFVTMLEACNQLAPNDEEWEDLVQTVMEQCRDAGYLSRRVLDMLRRGLQRRKIAQQQQQLRSLEQRLLGLDGDQAGREIPGSWTRNILPRNRPK